MNLRFLLTRIGFLLPIILCFIVMYLKHERVYVSNLIVNVFSALMIVILSNILGKNKISLAFKLFGLIIFNVGVYIKTAHLYLYNHPITKDTIFIFLETNGAESSEFLSTYFDSNLFLIGLAMLLAMLFSLYSLIYDYKNKEVFYKIKVRLPSTKLDLHSAHLLVFMLVFYFFVINPYYHRRSIFLIYSFVGGYHDYKREMVAYQKIGFEKLGGNFSEVVHQESDHRKTYVLIIGESTTRHHMGLYGYYRHTNPLLSKMKDELIIYEDIISPHTHTIASLTKVLTLGNYENPEEKYSGSFIQLFNKAGFKTYWLSVQPPAGISETVVSRLSNSSDQQHFIAHYGYQPVDEAVLSPLTEILSETEEKKFIVIHLMGTHASYKKRYPDNYNKFHSTPITPFEHEEAYQSINMYDNAVLYNDFVVSEIISQLKETNSKSWVLYFSDHGEDAFQTINSAGHLEKNGTQPMYDIPLVLWLSDIYKSSLEDLVFKPKRKYMTDDLIYTLADLANIRFQEFDSTRSLVNPNFEYRNRMILNNKHNYDEIFKKLPPIQLECDFCIPVRND